MEINLLDYLKIIVNIKVYKNLKMGINMKDILKMMYTMEKVD